MLIIIRIQYTHLILKVCKYYEVEESGSDGLVSYENIPKIMKKVHLKEKCNSLVLLLLYFFFSNRNLIIIFKLN